MARATFKAGQTTEVLDVLVEMTVDIAPVNPFDFFVDDRAKQLPFTYPDGLDAELAPFLETGDPAYRLGRKATELLQALPWTATPWRGSCAQYRVRERIAYVIRDEVGVWSPEETLTHGRGSCRDVAVLLIALMRSRGIAARFASGYLVQLADEGMIPDEPKGVDRDVVDLHAWAEAYVPGAGWIGFDATSGLLCGEGHIALAAPPRRARRAGGGTRCRPSDVRSRRRSRGLAGTKSARRLLHREILTDIVARRRAERARRRGPRVWIGGEPRSSRATPAR